MNGDMNKTEIDRTAGKTRHNATASAILWACAFVLTGMIISKLGDSPASIAHAEMTAQTASGISLMTTDTGTSSEEYVTVLDSPTQQLYVYDATMRDGFRLIARVDLAEAFATGRKAGE